MSFLLASYSTCSLCEPLDKDSFNDVATFASDLSGNFAGVVQYNKDNRAFEVAVRITTLALSAILLKIFKTI